jgi:hypothetical protein
MFVYLSIKDAHDRQYNYMKITIFTIIGMIKLIGFNIQAFDLCLKNECYLADDAGEFYLLLSSS